MAITLLRPTALILFIAATLLHLTRAAKRNPVRIFILAGDGAVEGFASLSELQELTESDPDNYGHLLVEKDKASNQRSIWKVRDDVYVAYQSKLDKRWEHKPLSADMGLSHSDEYFGPEIQLGHILGEIYEEPVVIIKCAWDNKSLAKDFRPPSAGGTTGRYYKQILLSVKQTLNNVDDILLGQAAKDYSGAGHSLEGLIWWHGYSDVEDKDHRESYSDHLKLFMNDIRKDLKRPYLPIVIGELGGMGTKRVTLYEHNFRVYQERSVKDDAVQMSYFVKTHDKLDQKDIGFDKVGYEYYYHQAAFMITIGAAFAEGLLLLLNGDDDAMGNINVDPYTSTNAQADFQSYVTNNHNMILLVFGALMMGLVLVYAVSRNSVSLRTGWSRTMEKIRPAVRAVVPTDDEGNLLLGVMVVPTNAMAEAASDSLAYIDSTARSTYAYADETVRSLRDVQFVLKTSESRDDSGAHVNDTGSAIEAGMVAA